jgi:hypothetical protein
MDTVTLTVLLLLAGILVLGGYLFVRLRQPREEPYYYFHCPGCGRKLRYRARQVGHHGMCPRCNQHWTFPPIPKG